MEKSDKTKNDDASFLPFPPHSEQREEIRREQLEEHIRKAHIARLPPECFRGGGRGVVPEHTSSP